MWEAVQNFIKLLRVGKVWKTEPDAEPGEKATGVGLTSKANTDAEPGGKTAGFGSTGKANTGRHARPPMPINLGRHAKSPVQRNSGRQARLPVPRPSGLTRRAGISRIRFPRSTGSESNRLLNHTEYDHKIELVEGANPPFGLIYPLLGEGMASAPRVSQKGVCGRQDQEI
jgi:hypothetical protein